MPIQTSCTYSLVGGGQIAYKQYNFHSCFALLDVRTLKLSFRLTVLTSFACRFYFLYRQNLGSVLTFYIFQFVSQLFLGGNQRSNNTYFVDFCFKKHKILAQASIRGTVPQRLIICQQGTLCEDIEAFCIVLGRFSCPLRIVHLKELVCKTGLAFNDVVGKQTCHFCQMQRIMILLVYNAWIII